MALAPDPHTSRRRDGAYTGRSPWAAMASSPLSPSTITERASCSVAPTKAIRADPSLSAIERTHSAPARVFPKPPPAIISPPRQPTYGALWVVHPPKHKLPFNPQHSYRTNHNQLTNH